MPATIQGPKIARIMSGMEKAITGGSRETIMAASMAAKTIHIQAINAVAGGDGRLSGVGKKGAKVGARFSIKGSTFAPTSIIKATGPLPLIDSDTKGHVIRSRHVRGKARRGFVGPTTSGQFKQKKVMGPSLQPVLHIPGIGYRRSARHPGTKGQHVWAKGKKRAQPAITKIIRKRTFNIVKRAAKA